MMSAAVTVTDEDHTYRGVAGFSSLEAGSLDTLRAMLCCDSTSSSSCSSSSSGTNGNGGEESSYLELIQARHHYFSSASASSTANIAETKAVVEEIDSIIKEFEENYRISNVVDEVSTDASVTVTDSVVHRDGVGGEDVLEEMELPPGDVVDNSMGDYCSGGTLQVDNFVDDESFTSPQPQKHKTQSDKMSTMDDDNEDSDDVDDDMDNAYIPSFGVSSPHAQENLKIDNEVCSQSGFTLDEMCAILKEDSDSDVESITDSFEARPVQINIPVSSMGLKLSTGRKIRTDADLFLEHYISNLSGTQRHDGGVDQEFVIDAANEIYFEENDIRCVADVADDVDDLDDLETKNEIGDFRGEDIPLRARRIMQEHFQSGTVDDSVVSESFVCSSNDRSYDKVEYFGD